MLHGKVIRFLQPRDEATGYTVFRFLPEEEVARDQNGQVICRGKTGMLSIGMPLEIEAEYQTKIYYSISNCRVYTAKKSYSMYFLRDIRGISDKTASKILSGLDNDICRLLDLADPGEYIDQIPGSKRYKVALLEKLRSIRNTEALYKELNEMGIEFGQVSRMLDIYGDNAAEAIKKDPYGACSKIGIGFLQSDYIARHYKLSMYGVNRMKSIAWEIINQNEDMGNTRISIHDFIAMFYRLLKQSAWPWIVPPVYLFAVMNTMHGIMIKDQWICSKKRYYQEKGIAVNLKRLNQPLVQMDISYQDISSMEDRIGLKYLESQKRLFLEMNQANVIVVLGKPGTGKTTAIKGAIELYKAKFPDGRISLCAPTARASQVMKESADYPASTIHSLVGIVPYGADFLGRNETDPLDCDLLVVDEMSMVDTETFYLLLRAVKNGCKVILSGDPDQIESVGCGDVFRSIVDSGIFHIVKLEQIMRQDKLSSIIENCKRILDGNSCLVTDEAFHVQRFQTEEEAKDALLNVYQNKNKLRQQILSTTKKGMLGITELNQHFEKALSGQACVRYRNFDYKIGDKIVFVRTDYKKGYCNGDIGIIEGLEPYVKIQVGDKLIQMEKYSLEDILPATVMTIHKSQGGEYDDVYILLPREPKILLNRNIINTAVSRARNRVWIFVEKDALDIALSNQTRIYRSTWLPEILCQLPEAVFSAK